MPGLFEGENNISRTHPFLWLVVMHREIAGPTMNETRQIDSQTHQAATEVHQACIAAALEAYESAKMSGLCDEGAWEAAVGAMRMIDVDAILNRPSQERPSREHPSPERQSPERPNQVRPMK